MAFVADQENNILLLQRIKDDFWEPVKWWSEEWETFAEWIYREFLEETWIKKEKIVEIRELEKFEDRLKFWEKEITIKWMLFFIRIKWIKPEVIINYDQSVVWDHKAYKWVSIQELEEMTIFSPFANQYKTKMRMIATS